MVLAVSKSPKMLIDLALAMAPEGCMSIRHLHCLG